MPFLIMVVLCDLTCVFYKRQSKKKKPSNITAVETGWDGVVGMVWGSSPHNVFSHITVVGIDDADVLSVYECHLFSCAGADHVFFTLAYWDL